MKIKKRKGIAEGGEKCKKTSKTIKLTDFI